MWKEKSLELNPDRLAQVPGCTYQLYHYPLDTQKPVTTYPNQGVGEFLKSIEVKIGKELMIFVES